MNEAQRFTSMRAQAVTQRISHSVLPLYRATDGGRPESFATCTLIEWHGERYFVTAGHTADDFATSEVYFGNTAIGKVNRVPAQALYLPQERADGPAPLDIAVAPVVRDNADEFHGCHFLNANDLGLGDRPDYANVGHSLYFMLGFSASRSQIRIQHDRRHITQNAFPLTAVPSAVEKYVSGKLDPAIHLALDYNDKDVNQGGQKVNPPKLRGVSGGGMFRFDGLTNHVKLVAIAIEHRKTERIVVGTRIDVVCALIDALVKRLGDELFD